MQQRNDDLSAEQFGGAAKPDQRQRKSWDPDVPFRLAFCSGALAGREVPLPGKEARIGRSSSSNIQLRSADATVSGRHAVLTQKDGRWSLCDLQSRSGTFLNGRRLASGQPTQVASGDWILFGAGGTAALLLGPGAEAPGSWIVLEAESQPGLFLAVKDQDEIRVALSDDGKLVCPPPKKSPASYRFRLDRKPPTVQSVSAKGKESERRPIKAGALLRPAEGRLGLRVLGAGTQATRDGGAAFGQSTMLHAIRTVARRKYALPVAGMAVLLVAAIIVAAIKFDSGDDDTARLEQAQLALAQDLAAFRARTEAKFVEQRALFLSSMDDLSSELRGTIEAHRKATEKQLAELSRGDRERFVTILEKYKRSVYLIYVENEITASDGHVYRSGGWGTGWIVRKDGLLLTNKHVVQGWKFDPHLMAVLDHKGIAGTKTAILAWPAGDKFKSGSSLNQRSGYNNVGKKNLHFVSAAPDRWYASTLQINGTAVASRGHALDANDMAVLKLSGSGFTPLPLMRDTRRVKPLDAVMTLGFSLGGRVLQQGRADVSPSMGTVRWVRDTVSHTASMFPGNSGGPLLNLDGEVVALLNAGARTANGSAETFGAGLRSDLVRKFVNSIP